MFLVTQRWLGTQCSILKVASPFLNSVIIISEVTADRDVLTQFAPVKHSYIIIIGVILILVTLHISSHFPGIVFRDVIQGGIL